MEKKPFVVLASIFILSGSVFAQKKMEYTVGVHAGLTF